MITLSRIAPTKLLRGDKCLIGKFKAMGCACEVLLDTEDEILGQKLFEIAINEAHRIEMKWSRYIPGNFIDLVNSSNGQLVEMDEETARLIGFADQCFQLSDGLFDITSGILRKAWTFDGKSHAPSQARINELLPLIGWGKVRWDEKSIQLQPGMEIDLGGIGKEYAVDRTLSLLSEVSQISMLVNFGGDIAVNHPRSDGRAWVVGIEDVNIEDRAEKTILLNGGALTTSGDSKRFVMIDGKRFGHILNPMTGWPVKDAPRSVTVAAKTCTEAGFLSTLAILKGKGADEFLNNADVRHWCY